MKNVKHCCKNCHFLNKTYRNDRGFEGVSSWSKEDRENLAVEGYYAASCWRGIWDTGINPELNAQLPDLLTQKRGSKCFFVEWAPGMSYSGAVDLHRSRNDDRRFKKSYRISAIALAVSVMVAVAAAVDRFLI